MHLTLPFLPGTLRITPGNWRDYKLLSRFHYRPKHPATWSRIWTIRHTAPGGIERVVAVAVVSYPTRCSAPRYRVLGVHGWRRRDLCFINRHVRTISRVIVHPQFRALGLSSTLVRWMCQHCYTRYLEASAQMGRAHPFFERGGMEKHEPAVPNGPIYYLYRTKSHEGTKPRRCTKGSP